MFDFVPWQEGEESRESIERLDWVRSMTDTPPTSNSNLTPSSNPHGLSSEHGVPRVESISNTSHSDPQDDIDINMTPYTCSSTALDTIPKTETEPNSQNMLEHRPRRGHKKSRRGCYNCKRRKIKVCFFVCSDGIGVKTKNWNSVKKITPLATIVWRLKRLVSFLLSRSLESRSFIRCKILWSVCWRAVVCSRCCFVWMFQELYDEIDITHDRHYSCLKWKIPAVYSYFVSCKKEATANEISDQHQLFSKLQTCGSSTISSWPPIPISRLETAMFGCERSPPLRIP